VMDLIVVFCILFVFMLVLYCFCVATEFSVNKDLYNRPHLRTPYVHCGLINTVVCLLASRYISYCRSDYTPISHIDQNLFSRVLLQCRRNIVTSHQGGEDVQGQETERVEGVYPGEGKCPEGESP